MRIHFNILLLSFVFTSQLFCEENLATHVIFNEVDIEYYYDPYSNITDWEGKAKRFYALIHETIYENDMGTLNPNFVASSPSLRHPVYKTDDIFEEGILTKFIIYLPDENQVAQQWKFSDGSKISAEDIKVSLQYAICKGLVKDALIPFENIIVEGNDVHILSPRKLSKDMYISSLKNLYILPSACFGDFVSQGCECPDHNGGIHGLRCVDDENGYDDSKCIMDWNDEATPVTTSGSFKVKDIISEQKITLEYSKQVASRKKKNLDGFIIKVNSIRAMHATDYPQKVNLLIDVPKSTISTSLKSLTTPYKMKPYSANLFWINYRGKNKKHLSKLNFRKAIRLAINKEKIVSSVFSYDAAALTGPFSEHSNFYEHNINEEKSTHDKNIDRAIELLNDIGYRINNGKLEDPDGNLVELQLMYNNSISPEEEEAITTSAVKNLAEIGIKVTERAIKGDSKFNSEKKRPDKWDLCYDEILIRNPQNVGQYYRSNGNKNYGRFKNNKVDDALQTLIAENDKATRSGVARRVHEYLANNVASIFLWRLDSHSFFNKTEISEENKNRMDTEHFFITPHQWEMEDNQEE